MKVNRTPPGIIVSLSVMIVMATTTTANAQKGFNVSVKATPQFSFLLNKSAKENDAYNSKATFNTNFGVGAGYNFTKNLGIAIDGLYSFQGQKFKLGGREYNQEINYIKIPVYFTANTDATRLVSFSGEVGPQVSLLSTSKFTFDNGKDSVSNTNPRLEKATFGGAAEAGVQFRINRQLFLVTRARFDVDFTKALHDNYTLYPAGTAKTYNMTTGLEVALKYQFL